MTCDNHRSRVLSTYLYLNVGLYGTRSAHFHTSVTHGFTLRQVNGPLYVKGREDALHIPLCKCYELTCSICIECWESIQAVPDVPILPTYRQHTMGHTHQFRINWTNHASFRQCHLTRAE